MYDDDAAVVFHDDHLTNGWMTGIDHGAVQPMNCADYHSVSCPI